MNLRRNASRFPWSFLTLVLAVLALRGRKLLPEFCMAAAMPLALGFGAVLAAYPQIHRALHWFGIAYLAWLAWRIATAGQAGPASRPRTPRPKRSS